MKKTIKLFDPIIDQTEKNAVLKVLNSKFWASGSGTGNVLEFEKKFKKYTNSKICIAVNSGTAALNLALSLFDLKNKEVILPSLSFVSTANSIIENGGRPVFIDIEPKTLCLNSEIIEQYITKKTALILPVHFGGFPCNLKKIHAIAKKYNLHIVEDAAHAAGTSYNNKKIGKHSDAVCFSFHPVKNLAMPTGGLIAINNSNYKKFSNLLTSRRWCGITNRKDTHYDVKELGWNYYMNEFSAAIGLAQLKKLDKLNRLRQKTCKMYFQKINTEKKMPFSTDSSYHFYWILVKNQKKFRQKMLKHGIETGTHYQPIHKMSMYKQKQKLPVTEKVGKTIVTLPTSPNLKSSEINYIIESINKSL
tara:strand:- start:23580 stop:24665 length:1086 start_codon:yes stop_codon:yes gene_type:complete